MYRTIWNNARMEKYVDAHENNTFPVEFTKI